MDPERLAEVEKAISRKRAASTTRLTTLQRTLETLPLAGSYHLAPGIRRTAFKGWQLNTGH